MMGTCVYSEQCGDPRLLAAVRENRVDILRVMAEVEKQPVTMAGLTSLKNAIDERITPINVHICWWQAHPQTKPPVETPETPTWVTSVGAWNEADLRYGWSEHPVNSIGDIFGGSGHPVTNYEYAWTPSFLNPFKGSARWSLGADALANRFDILGNTHKTNSGGLTRSTWIKVCHPHTDLIDLHAYAATLTDVMVQVEAHLKTWSLYLDGEQRKFFVGECGPHSRHEQPMPPEECAEWITAVDISLATRYGDRYCGVCWHGPNHIELLDHF